MKLTEWLRNQIEEFVFDYGREPEAITISPNSFRRLKSEWEPYLLPEPGSENRFMGIALETDSRVPDSICLLGASLNSHGGYQFIPGVYGRDGKIYVEEGGGKWCQWTKTMP